jgi:hypothetical protein
VAETLDSVSLLSLFAPGKATVLEVQETYHCKLETFWRVTGIC